jgi:hypothetical protein
MLSLFCFNTALTVYRLPGRSTFVLLYIPIAQLNRKYSEYNIGRRYSEAMPIEKGNLQVQELSYSHLFTPPSLTTLAESITFADTGRWRCTVKVIVNYTIV